MKIQSHHPRIQASQIPLESLAGNPNLSDDDKVAEVSRQFEAVLLRQILQEARKPGFGSSADSSLSSSVYSDMINQQLAETISRSGSVGLGKSLQTQLARQVLKKNAVNPTADSNTDSKAHPAAAPPRITRPPKLTNYVPPMIEKIEVLVSALREEMQQYGEMLALLDQQQEQVKARSSENVFRSVSLIEAQATVIQNARNQREECRQSVALEANRPDAASFCELIPLLPEDYRPLVKALVDENNQLLVRVRQRAHQNHILLRRSVELMESLITTLFSSLQTSVYNGNGIVDKHYSGMPSFYSCVG